MTARTFTYTPVTINIEGVAIELEACGEVDSGGKVFIDELYYKTDDIYSKPMNDLLEIQLVKDLIANQIKGRK